MKKLIAMILTTTFLLSLMAFPALADQKPASSKIYKKDVKYLEAQLKKTTDQLNKAIKDKEKLQDAIVKAIAKAKEAEAKISGSYQKLVTGAAVQIEKWEQELNKAAEHDKLELANLEKDIAKWTQMINTQKEALNKQIADINATLAKRLAELDQKILAAKDDATKVSLNTAKINLTNYANQRIAAINNYITAMTANWAERIKIWNDRKALLIKTQTADMALRTAMLNIKKAELNDKLVAAANVLPTPDSVIEAAVKAKYQKAVDSINDRIAKLNAIIEDLKKQIAALKK